MASLTLSSSFTASRHLTRAKPQLHPRSHSSTLSLNGVPRLFKAPSIKHRSATGVNASLGFSGSYFEGDYDYDFGEDGLVEEEGFGLGMSVAQATAAAALLEDREEPPCPPGCRRYECIVILRPDVTEEQRVAFIQRYEEILVAGGAMYVEVFNRGILPISYSIQKYNKDGTKGTYFEGIYLLFTFFTKPESIGVLENQLRIDFSVIRHYLLKIEKKKKPKEEVAAN
ncbi:30S ribosomal protein S6 [Rhynchospora pubera]|uniref:30S ribosomal protein S6 n=1 Tax=Rhynchospora pubera TaxID=906938 RepID=A0AAV8C340_9POAL|nr:30S ribosomal protein S6 [Rhynchospora pubera]